MAQDASFEDGAENPLRLLAADPSDVSVLSALVQDAVAQTSDMVFERKKRRFALLLNRFRWEDADGAKKRERPFERVQSMLAIDGVSNVASQGIDPRDKELVLALIAVEFVPHGDADDPGGRINLIFSGDGALALDVECVEMQLKDVSKPYAARAKDAPSHPLD